MVHRTDQGWAGQTLQVQNNRKKKSDFFLFNIHQTCKWPRTAGLWPWRRGGRSHLVTLGWSWSEGGSYCVQLARFGMVWWCFVCTVHFQGWRPVSFASCEVRNINDMKHPHLLPKGKQKSQAPFNSSQVDLDIPRTLLQPKPCPPLVQQL